MSKIGNHNSRKYCLKASFRQDSIGNLVWTMPKGQYFVVSNDLFELLSLLNTNGYLYEQDILNLGYDSGCIAKISKLGLISPGKSSDVTNYNVLNSKQLSEYKYPPPTTIEWYPSFECNQHCSFCYIYSNCRDPYSASKVDIQNLLRNIQGSGIFKIALLGGEPTLWKDLPTFLIKTINKPYDISFSTNGSNITDALLKIIRTHRTCQLTFSLHSGSAIIHNKIVDEPEAFSLAVKNIKKTIDSGNKCSIACVYCPEIEDTYESLIQLGSMLNVEQISFLYQQYGEASSRADSYFLKFENFVKKAIGTGKKLGIPINAPNFYVFHSPYRKVPFNKKSKRAIWLYGLKDGKTRIDITPRGNVYPSFKVFDLENFKYGNIYKTNFETIWLNNNLHESIHGNRKPKVCRQCKYLYICGGGNIFSNYKKAGELYSQIPKCPIYNKS